MEGDIGCVGESGWAFHLFMPVLGKLLISDDPFKALSIYCTFGGMTESLGKMISGMPWDTTVDHFVILE